MFAKRVAVCGLFGVLAAGCDQLMQQPRCPVLSDCGGAVPIGTWTLAPGHGSCSEDVYVAPTDQRLPGGVVPAARTAPPEPALYDWCDQLITKAFDTQKGILRTAPIFYAPDAPVGIAQVSYGMDGTYSAGLGTTGTYSLTFPSLCMREFGAKDGNPVFDPNMAMTVGGPVNLCKQLELPLHEAGNGSGAIPDTSCDVDPDQNDPGGCVCTFTANMEGGGGGTYVTANGSNGLDGSTILNLPIANFPQKVTFCNTGNELQLTGADGQYLFGTVGLRTLDLVKVP